MGRQVTPEFAMKYTKFTTGHLFSWPPSRDASRLQLIGFQICWWISWLLSIAFSIPLISMCYQRRKDFMECTKYICLSVCVVQVIVKMVVCRRQYHRFQSLFADMGSFVKDADHHQRQVLTDCTNFVMPHYLKFNSISFGAGILVILGPLTSDQPLPLEAEFPFPVDQQPVYGIIYFFESICIIQCCCTGGLDCQIGILLWFAKCRLDLLSEKLRNVRSSVELRKCIKAHQYLLWYIDESIKACQGVVLTTIIFTTISIVCGSVHIVGNSPIEARIQFTGICLGYILELLAVGWAAENMTEACQRIGWALYESPWIKNSIECNKIAMLVIQRSKKVPQFRVGGFLPELSLAYYAKYVSKTMSFFTTLHMILQRIEGSS